MIVLCVAGVTIGTTAIAQCFRGAKNFVDLGEIFYDSADGMGHYVKRWEHPNPPSLERFAEYLGFLRKDPHHVYWLDIKFHDLNRFNPRQMAVTARPKLVGQLLQSGDPMLLISRANPLRAAASAIQAQMTGVSHGNGPEDPVTTPADHGYDRGRTIAAIRAAVERRAEFRVVEAHLRTHPKLFRVDYEALFDCPEAAANRAALGSWIGADVVSEPDLPKVFSGWPDWFDRDLAAEILRGTSGQWWVA